MPRYQRHVFVCTNERPPEDPKGCCAAKGSEAIRARLKEEISRRKLKAFVRASKSSCLANCSEGVTVVVYPEAVWYSKVTLGDVDEIVERHILRGEVVERLVAHSFAGGPAKLPALQLPESVAALQARRGKDTGGSSD
ncbi:MAG TPA: (2Fe-2S) ferredoxin domain-containing protein [Candidatus Saccharimonadales bacterium]|nr:(2Fe-2S) ferredoxin domain-containing protein [Candidatus Saccharimonadales bacterium]